MTNMGVRKNAPTQQAPARCPADFEPYPPDLQAHPLAWPFEQQAQRRPNQPAIWSPELSLTYGELNTRANRLAHWLLAEPRASHAPIALLLPQGASGLTAMLACLKAGMPYFGIDPTLPAAQIAALLNSTQSQLILSDGTHSKAATGFAGKHGVAINLESINKGIEADPRVSIPLDQIAIIGFTSGTTGTPKGVVHTHQSIQHMVWRRLNYFQIAPSDRQTWLRPIGVIAPMDTFTALAAGATVYALDLHTTALNALAVWLAEHRLTSASMAVTLFRQLAASLEGGGHLPDLRYFITGGETVYTADVELFRRHFAPGSLFSVGWGATEVNTVTTFEYDHQTPLAGSTLHCGWPMADVRLFILDEDGQPVPAGEAGEIAVSTPSLAAGYWQQPELTEARFRPDPVEGSTRIYRSGDRGRLLPDGRLEHLGRLDDQIKVRGYRVEPAAIVQILRAQPGVEQAAVVLQRGSSGAEWLVAYIIPARESQPGVDTLRQAVNASLPEYMRPSTYMFVETFPYTSIGKLDRSRLPLPSRARPMLAAPYHAPDSPVEQALARIWREALELDQIGLDDAFLELGGNSLLAGHIVARVLKEFRVELPLQSLFDAPTIRSMALLITVHRAQQLSDEQLSELLRAIDASLTT